MMRSLVAFAVLASGALVFAPGDDCVQVRADLVAARKRIAALETEIVKLHGELDAAQAARLDREREWLRYTQGMAQLEKFSTPAIPRFDPQVPGAAALAVSNAASSSPSSPSSPSSIDAAQPAAAPTVAPALAPAAAHTEAPPVASTGAPGPKPASIEATLPPDPIAVRSHAVLVALRSLLALEQVTGFDLLEAGFVQPGFTGPVVLRVLDARSRPLGTLSADRLRLEASRAARTLTIVLENGYEHRGGVKTPFEGSPPDPDGRAGVRRIVLPDTDPKPWLDAVPELFRDEDKTPIVNDGLHDLGKLRATLNQLLHAQASGGEYRVLGIGGVQASVLRDVAIDVLDADGRIEKRLFADRLAVLREAQGIQILLEGGSQMRGDQKTPFLDGRYRIFLPRASADVWKEAGIPGLIQVGAAQKD